MSIEVKVPQLPESVSEATVGPWHKQQGDAVARDENLVDLETDKVMLEVPSIVDGAVLQILKNEGDTVTSGDVLAVVEEGAAASTAEATESAAESNEAPAETDGDVALSPAVRKMITEHNLDPAAIPATGKGGRLVKSDVQAFIDNQGAQAAPAAAAPAAATAPVAETASAPIPAPGERVEQRVPMTRIRARIAERLIEAQQNAAILTTFNEVDLFEVDRLRKTYKDAFEKEHDVRLGFMSFFVKAAVENLKKYPVVNASVDGSDVIYHGYYDIGIAVSSPRGLVVPILRDVDTMNLGDIEKSIRQYGKKAQDGKLGLEDMTGGTFSITNGGVFGSMMSTPILNPPQSAILGMHGITQRPVVVDGEIKIRPMMYLALSYDHRIIDGKEAVLFLRGVKEALEDPARLLLQI